MAVIPKVPTTRLKSRMSASPCSKDLVRATMTTWQFCADEHSKDNAESALRMPVPCVHDCHFLKGPKGEEPRGLARQEALARPAVWKGPQLRRDRQFRRDSSFCHR